MAISDVLANAVDEINEYLAEDLDRYDAADRAAIEAVVIHMDRVRALLDTTFSDPRYAQRMEALKPITAAVEPLRQEYEQDRAAVAELESSGRDFGAGGLS